jgi:hypothetical protein
MTAQISQAMMELKEQRFSMAHRVEQREQMRVI